MYEFYAQMLRTANRGGHNNRARCNSSSSPYHCYKVVFGTQLSLLQKLHVLKGMHTCVSMSVF